MSASAARLRPVTHRIDGQPAEDGGGVKLTRMFDARLGQLLDPFLMLDEFRSDSAADYLAGFPPHPHRGFETVTYMMAGRMRHADNQGNTGDLGPGALQWMTAARGIVHEEMPQQEDGLMWGYQLWVNLPAREKMGPPAYQDIPAERIPERLHEDGARVRVLAGRYAGVDAAVRARPSDPTYLDVSLPAGGRWRVEPPEGYTVLVHGVAGEMLIGDARLAARQLAVLGRDGAVEVEATEGPARFLFIAGRPFREPVAHYGPFVMNTPGELQQAVDDYRAGRF